MHGCLGRHSRITGLLGRTTLWAYAHCWMIDSEVIASFCGITGAGSDVAAQMLEAANGDIEHAINIFFAAEAGQGVSDREDDETLARRLQQ